MNKVMMLRLAQQPRELSRTLLKVVLFCVVALAFIGVASAKQVENWSGVPETLRYGNTNYQLAWSANPSNGYYKYEYLPRGQKLESFQDMMIVEILYGVKPEQAAGFQISQLEGLKGKDPIVNYSLMSVNNDKELILDFVMSAPDENGQLIVEWNGYRYMSYVDSNGNEGVMLIAIVHRVYGDKEIKPFLENLRAIRERDVEQLIQFQLR